MPKVSHIKLNFSTAEKFYTCRRRWYFESVGALVPVGAAPDETLQASYKGTLIHAALEAHAKGLNPVVAMTDLIPPGSGITLLKPSQSGSVKHLTEVVEAYISHYSPDEYEVIQAEQKLTMPVDDLLTLNGTIDSIMLHKTTGRVTIGDYKSSSNFGLFTKPTIDVSDQFSIYIALARASGHHFINSCLVDMVSTTMTDLNRFKSGDTDALLQRHETFRSDAQLAEALETMKGLAREMKYAIENEYYPKTPKKSICSEFKSACPFLEVCSAESALRASMIKTGFVPSLNASFEVTYEK